MTLLLPERDVRDEFNSRIMEQVERVHDYTVMHHFNPLLKDIDSRLELVRAPENVTDPALKPGYWHILRLEPGNVVTVLPVQQKDGSYMEPGSQMFDDLRSADLWSDRVQKDRKETQRKIKAAQEREKVREREDTTREIVERIRSKENASVGWRRSVEKSGVILP